MEEWQKRRPAPTPASTRCVAEISSTFVKPLARRGSEAQRFRGSEVAEMSSTFGKPRRLEVQRFEGSEVTEILSTFVKPLRLIV